jgi:hypothetical protein
MRITRQKLKQIITEEISLVENIPDVVGIKANGGNAPADEDGMGEITEGEGMEMLHQAAQTLIDAGILGAESPEELMMALKGLGKAAILPLAGIAMGTAAMAGKDAIDKLRSNDAHEEPETIQEEESSDVLTNLITQTLQEHLG